MPLYPNGSANDAAAQRTALPLLGLTGEDLRTFRRYPLSQEIGVQLASECAPHRLADATLGMHNPFTGLSYRSVHVHNLSLTGLYFVSTLPYRTGCWLDIQMPLSPQNLHLYAVVRRVVPLTQSVPGGYQRTFGCGANFLYSRMSAQARQALMEFLIQRFSSSAIVPIGERETPDTGTLLPPL